MTDAALITDPLGVLATLLIVLGTLFWAHEQAWGKRIFRVVPLLVFAYFVPALLSNTGVLPLESDVYTLIKKVLLPASLVLLVLSVDIVAIGKLGREAVLLLLAGTAGIVFGGPLAVLALGWMIPAELGDQAWKASRPCRA